MMPDVLSANRKCLNTNRKSTWRKRERDLKKNFLKLYICIKLIQLAYFSACLKRLTAPLFKSNVMGVVQLRELINKKWRSNIITINKLDKYGFIVKFRIIQFLTCRYNTEWRWLQ